jgi:hypothetical protein
LESHVNLITVKFLKEVRPKDQLLEKPRRLLLIGEEKNNKNCKIISIKNSADNNNTYCSSEDRQEGNKMAPLFRGVLTIPNKKEKEELWQEVVF